MQTLVLYGLGKVSKAQSPLTFALRFKSFHGILQYVRNVTREFRRAFILFFRDISWWKKNILGLAVVTIEIFS